MVRIKLAGFSAIDRRTAGARATLAFRRDLIAALGGEADLSPQRRRLVDLAARASMLVDHVDAWLLRQRSLIDRRTKSVLPVLVQRQSLAEHLAKLLDRLGLDRRRQDVPDLTSYLAERYSAESSGDTASEAAQAPTNDTSPAEPPDGTTTAEANDHERHEEVAQDGDDRGTDRSARPGSL